MFFFGGDHLRKQRRLETWCACARGIPSAATLSTSKALCNTRLCPDDDADDSRQACQYEEDEDDDEDEEEEEGATPSPQTIDAGGGAATPTTEAAMGWGPKEKKRSSECSAACRWV